MSRRSPPSTHQYGMRGGSWRGSTGRSVEHGRPVCVATVGQRGSYKPKAKSSAAQRESEGLVVPTMTVQNNVIGGKGPCFGHSWGEPQDGLRVRAEPTTQSVQAPSADHRQAGCGKSARRV